MYVFDHDPAWWHRSFNISKLKHVCKKPYGTHITSRDAVNENRTGLHNMQDKVVCVGESLEVCIMIDHPMQAGW